MLPRPHGGGRKRRVCVKVPVCVGGRVCGCAWCSRNTGNWSLLVVDAMCMDGRDLRCDMFRYRKRRGAARSRRCKRQRRALPDRFQVAISKRAGREAQGRVCTCALLASACHTTPCRSGWLAGMTRGVDGRWCAGAIARAATALDPFIRKTPSGSLQARSTHRAPFQARRERAEPFH